MSGSSPSDQHRAAERVLEPTSVGRYLVFDEIGVGGMASVHIGLLSGAVGFRRIVAVKQLHTRFVHDPEFVAQFINEARLAARIHHTNVVQTLDVVWTGAELLLVLEYVDGDTLNRVLKSAAQKNIHVPLDVACSVLTGVLHGLHAAHEARDEEGVPLNIVHRDVSPQNILLARDGVARVLDFGVAKAAALGHHTESGLIKGKFGYMAPEQIMRSQIDRRTDVFAAGVVLWETLTRRRLFQSSKNIEKALSRVISGDVQRPSLYRPDVPPELDLIVMKAIDRDPDARFQSAESFAVAIDAAVAVASTHVVKTWFDPIASSELAQRAELIRVINRKYANQGRTPTPQPGEMQLPEVPIQSMSLGPASRNEETRKVMMVRENVPIEPSSTGSGEVSVSGPVERGPSTPRQVVPWPTELFEIPGAPGVPNALEPLLPFAASGLVEPFGTRLWRHRILALVALALAAMALVVAMGWGTDHDPTDAESDPMPAAALPTPKPPATVEPKPPRAPIEPPVVEPPIITLPPAEPDPQPQRQARRVPASPRVGRTPAKRVDRPGADSKLPVRKLPSPSGDLDLRPNR